MPDLRIKIEEDGNTKIEATVNNFVTEADADATVNIYNDGNENEGVKFTIFFPGAAGLTVNPIEVEPGPDPYEATAVASAGEFDQGCINIVVAVDAVELESLHDQIVDDYIANIVQSDSDATR